MRNISLTGVPGAGKSTIAKILAELEIYLGSMLESRICLCFS